MCLSEGHEERLNSINTYLQGINCDMLLIDEDSFELRRLGLKLDVIQQALDDYSRVYQAPAKEH